MWKSSKIEDGSKYGINNAGQEMMKEDRIKNLVRESIQNSLDAIDDHSKPLRFEIEKVKIKTHDIPGIDDLIERFELVKNSWAKDEKVLGFCDNALMTLHSSYIECLRISDYNTTGLLDINDPNGAFHSLVKGTGYSVKRDSNSGGSFGIGKSVFWANSSLRSVFINSKNIDGEKGFIGRSELATIEKDSNIYSHIMFFGTDNYGHLDNVPYSLANILNRGEESGTDVLVIGLVDYDIKEKFEHEILKSVISEFYVSIKKGLLEFKIIDSNTSLVTKDNLDVTIKNLDSVLSDEKYFVETLEMIDVYSDQYKDSYTYRERNFNIYMKQSENGLKIIRGIRNTGMIIHKFINRGIHSDIVSLVELEDNYLSTLFKEMENPEHNKWDPSLIESPIRRKEAKDAIDYINSCIKETLNRVCPVDDSKRFTIDSLNELIQNNIEGDVSTKRSATIVKAQAKKMESDIKEQNVKSVSGNEELDISHNDTITKNKDNSTPNNQRQVFDENGDEIKHGKNVMISNVKILSIGNSTYNIFVRDASAGAYCLNLFLETEISNRNETISNFTTSLDKTSKGVAFTLMNNISAYTLVGSIKLNTTVKKSIGGHLYEIIK